MIKLTYFNLRHEDTKIGLAVSPINVVKKAGVIVVLGPLEEHWGNIQAPNHVMVKWASGKQRNKVEQVPVSKLLNLEKYLAKIKEEYEHLDNLYQQTRTVDLI